MYMAPAAITTRPWHVILTGVALARELGPINIISLCKRVLGGA
jgi:hypothetical protein